MEKVNGETSRIGNRAVGAAHGYYCNTDGDMFIGITDKVFFDERARHNVNSIRRMLDEMNPGDGETLFHGLYGYVEGQRLAAHKAGHTKNVQSLTESLRRMRKKCDELNIYVRDDPFEYEGRDIVQFKLTEMERNNPSTSTMYRGFRVYRKGLDPVTNQPIFAPRGLYSCEPVPITLAQLENTVKKNNPPSCLSN